MPHDEYTLQLMMCVLDPHRRRHRAAPRARGHWALGTGHWALGTGDDPHRELLTAEMALNEPQSWGDPDPGIAGHFHGKGLFGHAGQTVP